MKVNKRKESNPKTKERIGEKTAEETAWQL